MSDRIDAAARWIIAFQKQHGYGPTLTEIGKGMGIRSKTSAAYLLKLMRKAGVASWLPHHTRSIRVHPRIMRPTPDGRPWVAQVEP